MRECWRWTHLRPAVELLEIRRSAGRQVSELRLIAEGWLAG